MLTPGRAVVIATASELAAAYALVITGVHARRRSGYPLSAAQLALADEVGAAYAQAARGHAAVPPTMAGESSPVDPLSTADAAAMLGVSPRQARRLAAGLGARRTGSGWVWDKTAIIEYLEDEP